MFISVKRFLVILSLLFSVGFLASCAPQAVTPVTTFSFPVAVKAATPTYIAPAKFEEGNANELILRILQEESFSNTHIRSRFLLTDRDASSALFDQIVDQQLGLLSDDAVVEMGNQLGAKYAMTFTGTMSVLDDNPLQGVGRGNSVMDTVNTVLSIAQPTYVRATISLRLTDIETGAIVATGNGQGSRAGGILSGVPLQESFRDASKNALNQLLSNYIARGFDK